MRPGWSLATVVSFAATVAIEAGYVSDAVAQTPMTSLEQVREQLAAGDFIRIVPTAGPVLSGHLIRVGEATLDLRLKDQKLPGERQREVLIRLTEIRSIERPRDSTRNGTILGAAVGASIGAAMFVNALIVDRNEVDEWMPLYAGLTAVSTVVGGLIGWTIDTARSKPHVRFDATLGKQTRLAVRPVVSRDRVVIVVMVSR
jgi:HAMP domain-containing protein